MNDEIQAALDGIIKRLQRCVNGMMPKVLAADMVDAIAVAERGFRPGNLFVLKTGIAWEDFPHEMGCCGMTLWNRLNDGCRAGVSK